MTDTPPPDDTDPEERNTGLPASTPYSEDEWGPPSVPGHWEQQPARQEEAGAGTGQWGQQYGRPAFAPPDPAAVGGPPWPVLVAVGHYVPPRMIRWPIVAGFLAVAACIGIALAVSGSSTISHRVWVADHMSTLDAINQDQRALNADNPAQGGSATKWLADWGTFHNDIAAAATAPNPGGSATAPWREMINDYYNGSSEIVQAVRNRDQTLLSRAERDLTAGDQAAHQFDSAMDLASP